jgi:hypothetical protein
MMEPPVHTLSDLFRQLGLPDDDSAIRQFIASHRLWDGATPLAEARFWNGNQAAFLQEALANDADWAELVDRLDASLRHEPRGAQDRDRDWVFGGIHSGGGA